MKNARRGDSDSMTTTPPYTIPLDKEAVRVLRKVASTGMLDLSIDFSALPGNPDKKRDPSAYSMAWISATTGGIKTELMQAAALLCQEMPWDTTIAFRKDRGDVVVRFYNLSSPKVPDRMCDASTTADGRAILWLDIGATRWGLRPKRRWFGQDVVCLRSMLIRGLAWALGVGATGSPASLFYRPGAPTDTSLAGALAAALLEDDLPYWDFTKEEQLPDADRAALKDFFARATEGCVRMKTLPAASDRDAARVAWAAGNDHPMLEELKEEAKMAAAESGADRELDFDPEEWENIFIERSLFPGQW